MAYPTISELPEPPQRGEVRQQFVDKANAFVAALPTFQSETNAAGQFVETKAAEAEADAASASTDASTATSAASTATTARDDAQDARDAAQAVRDELWALYLGVQSDDPTEDKNGDPLSEGAWYINSGSNQLRVYQGGAWETYVTPNYSVGTAGSDVPTNDDLPNSSSMADQQTTDSPAGSELLVRLDRLAASPLSRIPATGLYKASGNTPAWVKTGADTLEVRDSILVYAASTTVRITGATSITMPTLTGGTDYTIYALDDGTLEAVDADSAAPANSRAVGGFHASAGGASVVASSLWDLNWRPRTASPRGMVLSLDGATWVDIYLMDTNYGLNGYSRNGAQIADDNDRPIKPDSYGGDGSTTYSSMSWWVAVDLATAVGKRLPFYQEFTAFAFGVVERQAVGSDPGTTQHQAGHRSDCGVEQVTGVMHQWGADINGTTATGSGSWQDIAEGRGDVYMHSIRSPRFGAHWDRGSNAGSRASNWNNVPDNSGGSIGARGVCDHLNLQPER